MDIKFCENLKSIRKETGFTQKEVALKLGVVGSCFSNWEHGRTEPNVEMLRRLSEIFDVTVDELIK